ncbi:PTS fructose transporter subunit IIA [Staphylococcus schleiferi subsp. coagulans]|uniref:PTS sugar transporter subunit IIA n=1 Tax=Staphylococcus coagulans TaxID=74706 RepID=UPI0015F799A9|nr:PTS fructose transporter subunit IIA [Staphylococcus coagulans]MBA8760552.1 PTS fructose transporter subunit IIA [Staphylococcus coagulans]MBA8769285.1 PTS fructose transporter subunit IIA [Staphylococcus coagulans]
MEKLILVSHGTFCEGIKDSIEMILGPQAHLYTVALSPQEGPEDFEKNFMAHIEAGDKVTVFADLLGGTPSNTVAKKIMNGADYDLYVGMNLPMIISYINGQMIGEQPDYVKKAQEGIVYVNTLLNQDDDDDDE